ncbi:hypothetical protein [Streptomyces sp. NPDC046925]|uniref:hypothetical protein n=1 Tax=Streptomyces sp. NPDC046925 TaxID=3155375 RepID=UPI003409F067
MTTYPHRIRLRRGHLTHLARSTRSGLAITQLTTACGHTYTVLGIADLSADDGRLCRGCEIGAKNSGDFPVLGSMAATRKGA